jgi:hypothetical protein
MSDPTRHGWPGRVAVALTSEETPRVFLAESDEVLSRVLAVHLVAKTSPRNLKRPYLTKAIRSALLDGRWAEAVDLWMEATGEVLDAYPDEILWTVGSLDDERASLEIRMAAIFEDDRG